MDELNPNHPVTRGMHDHWHKIAALLMQKMGVRRTVISLSELNRLADSGTNITIRMDDAVGIELTIVSDEEALRLARKEGGLPV